MPKTDFDSYEGEACTRTPDCPCACRGYVTECKSPAPDGCQACQMAYGDFLSAPD